MLYDSEDTSLLRTESQRAERTRERNIMTTNYEQIYNLLITSQPIT